MRESRPTGGSAGIDALTKRIVRCRRCPRLVSWRSEAARTKVKRFKDSKYWGRPVPGFGDPSARLLLVGLAPAAHGGNRTGRMFTGDESGNWLYRALWKAGFANQPTSSDRDDGLQLADCYVTATCRCAPPLNKLLPEEIDACRPFLLEEFLLLSDVRVVVGLGRIGFNAAFDAIRELGRTGLKARPRFGHGLVHRLNERLVLIASFHPSQQNTYTGRLTEKMLDGIFISARKLLAG